MRAFVSGRKLGGVLAQHFGTAIAGMRPSQEHFDGGRLAGPVAAKQTVDHPLGYPQIEAVEGTVTRRNIWSGRG